MATRVPYVNIHNHGICCNSEDTISVRSFFAQEWQPASTHDGKPFTIGLHPWHVGEVDLQEALERISEALQTRNCIGIGEIGLDRVVNVPFDKQLAAFEAQLLLAKQLKRTVVLHNVKSTADILQIVKRVKFNLPIIFHGFTGKPEAVQQILHAGGSFSFGQHLLTHPVSALSVIPKENLFFETDESSYTIEQIYAKASEILGLPLGDLKQIVYNNYIEKLFEFHQK